MLAFMFGCCWCREGSSSSSSSGSNSQSESIQESDYPSDGSGSNSYSSVSDSDGYPTSPCEWCKDGVSPIEFQMEWALVDNCPSPTYLPDSTCMDFGVGPHYGIIPTSSFSIGGHCATLFTSETCFYKNSGTGELHVSYGTNSCGTCAAPQIKVAVGRDSVGTYFMLCEVMFFASCVGGGFPPPPYMEDVVQLLYLKTSSLPLNCLGVNELELVCADGYFNLTDPPGTGTSAGVGPGCNYVFRSGGGFTTTFPTTITLKPSDGGGTFP